MLSVVKLNVVMLSVVTPSSYSRFGDVGVGIVVVKNFERLGQEG